MEELYGTRYQSGSFSLITTGRVVGDDGQPTFTEIYGDKKSRPDHVLLSLALCKLVCSFKMWDTCASDHAALSTEFRVNVVGGESANTKHHVDRIGRVSTTWFCVGSMRSSRVC